MAEAVVGDLFITACGSEAVTPRAKLKITLPPNGPDSLYDERDANHLCRVCGLWGAWGYGVAQLKGRTGRFACFAHRAQVEGMAA